MADSFQDLLEQRLSRRQVLNGAAALIPLAAAPALFTSDPVAAATRNTLRFAAIDRSRDDVVLPDGYTYDLVARWGDSLFTGTPDIDMAMLAEGGLLKSGIAEQQTRQFGQNCDAIRYFPLDSRGKRGLLCVNHEYTSDELMFASHDGFDAKKGAIRGYIEKHPQVVPVTQAAQGVSVIEIALGRDGWRLVKDSRFNRRITAHTPAEIRGPARGTSLVRTKGDPTGTRVFGTFAGCAGGETPWGTYLSAEENIQDYFGNLRRLKEMPDVDPFVIDAHRRFRMRQESAYGWDVTDPRFDLVNEPCEPFRFGWIVEIDPRDPQRPPVKRTALGRFAHEGAGTVVAKSGHVAVYMGDDDKFEHIYKFVTSGRFDKDDLAANRDLLDAGALYVARFDADGTGRWLPMVFDSRGPLNERAGFRHQGDVVIKARAAATVLGATPMDRPEDMEVNPVTGRIYVSCTNNAERTALPVTKMYAGREVEAGPDAANPRGKNPWGHIIEIHENDDDHTSLEFRWEVFILAGDPRGKLITDIKDVRPGIDRNSAYFAGYANAADLSPIGSPDNLGFDPDGNLWVVTDGPQPRNDNNGCWVCPTTGPDRGRLRQFMSGPIGAEICGCQFTPDGETFFLSIQHPGEGGSVLKPRSHWPDGPGTQPRSSVIAVRKKGGGRVGT
ncbi:hypothetical protein HNQ60_002440 [Povalibacter uvarum]|uniref:PhoX family phosphatase n=1 Tax=Povalibacter uvarum TaxID=732238 RepID=A0A841HMI2_9GAMM|nr:PhoX family phosphatase [Povalibacter uvarum]MBB6093559.1 hypothetical protein [Povalibacter uvarum]